MTRRVVLHQMRPWWNVAQPVWSSALVIAGLWVIKWYFDRLGSAAWHHGPVVWVAGALAAAYGAWDLVQAARARLRFRAWLRLADTDPRAALASLDEVQRMSRDFPPWLLRKYHRTRARLRHGDGAD